MEELTTLAKLLFTAEHRSRRLAKRMLRESGGAGNAAELEHMLRFIEDHPRASKIKQLAAELATAHKEATLRRSLPSSLPGSLHESWIVGEGTSSRRTYLLYLCPGGSESFLAEVFDADDGVDGWPLDEGQRLGNVLWIDGEVPADDRLHSLFSEARRQLRLYDAIGDQDMEEI